MKHRHRGYVFVLLLGFVVLCLFALVQCDINHAIQ